LDRDTFRDWSQCLQTSFKIHDFQYRPTIASATKHRKVSLCACSAWTPRLALRTLLIHWALSRALAHSEAQYTQSNGTFTANADVRSALSTVSEALSADARCLDDLHKHTGQLWNPASSVEYTSHCHLQSVAAFASIWEAYASGICLRAEGTGPWTLAGASSSTRWQLVLRCVVSGSQNALAADASGSTPHVLSWEYGFNGMRRRCIAFIELRASSHRVYKP